MKITEKVEVETVVNIRCDICCKLCKNVDSTCQNVEYATLKAMWGYDTNKDQEIHETHFCEECYDKLVEFIKQLGGTISVQHYDPWDPCTFRDDL